MKVHFANGLVGYPSIVREKHEHPSNGQNQSSSRHSHPEQNTENQENSSPEEVAHAVRQFEEDLQAQLHGLSASIENDGPGLKVVLTDRSGTFIRRLSGGEFIKLREALSPEIKVSGKLLDRKL